MKISGYKKLFNGCVIIAITLFSCKSGPIMLFKAASPHEQYERKLINAGLGRTAMGMAWIGLGKESLQKTLAIQLPYQEKGYFAADRVTAAAFHFNLTRGQKIQVKLTKNPPDEFNIYMDLWEQTEEGKHKLFAAADTLGNPLEPEVSKTGTYILRLQPELLSSGAYTLEITLGPSLAYPLKTSGRNQIQSFFGDGRDANSRKHEGIDVFAPFRTPVLAVAAGTVTGVNENNLGGKVVWLRPTGKDYTLYYAHLDEQTVTQGQSVLPGDTLGRMGNTGNAKTTPPHLHFGVYTGNGAVDPFPFINPQTQTPPKILADTDLLNTGMRTTREVTLFTEVKKNVFKDIPLKKGSIVHVNAATGNNYRVELPDGRTGYIQDKMVSTLKKPITKYNVKSAEQQVYDKPDSLAAVKLNLKTGQKVDILGYSGIYQLIMDENKQIGWIK